MARELEIVVVDDEEQITNVLRAYIGFISPGARVHEFNSSPAARDYLASTPVDMVITDFKMPLLDGLSLLTGIPATVRKVMVSGYVSEISREKLKELNATFLEKPVTLVALGKIIAEEERKIRS